jgi:phosphotransferase system  glucose/maltose/N-acetylglucosamine-specific IIC component
MAGFFPVMMFGLPAACLAMYHAALPERRKAVGGMLLSLALTSALTGVTEPIEFSFMFLAPVLYAIHAVLTGLSMALMNALGVKLGFGFSAGLFDYVLNYGKATKPLLLLPVGLAYAAIYYVLFRTVIKRLDLPTPGRERDAPVAAAAIQAELPQVLDFICRHRCGIADDVFGKCHDGDIDRGKIGSGEIIGRVTAWSACLDACRGRAVRVLPGFL